MHNQAIAIVDDVRFDAHTDPYGQHPECPERLLAARQGLYGRVPEPERAHVAVRPATPAELQRMHTAQYLASLDERLRGGYGELDADTYFSPGTREAAFLAAGGAIDLTKQLLRGAATRGIALLRPPGHHAVAATSMGFCVFNNVALAASEALAQGLQRVAIVDWDVHHGNGTQDMFYDDPRVLFVSLHQYPFYPGTGAAHENGRGPGAGYTANLPLPAGCGDEVYGEAFRKVVLPVLKAFQPELLLVSAGFDAHARDPLASMQLSSAMYCAMAGALLDVVDGLGHGRIGFLLEGGYDLQAIEASVAQVARAIRGERIELAQGAIPERAELAIDASRRALGGRWPQLMAAD
ncbi:MAG TPA: histone deacetylase [Polyangiales bacterium]|nr:histone deacetylase [Polyangiales bacterium]